MKPKLKGIQNVYSHSDVSYFISRQLIFTTDWPNYTYARHKPSLQLNSLVLRLKANLYG